MCSSITGYDPGQCVPVALGYGCQYWEEKCRPTSRNFNPDECVPSYMLAACSLSLTPDGVACADTIRHSENEALCTAQQHGSISGTECITYTWLSDSSLLCRIAPGLSQAHDVRVEVNSQAQSLSNAFSYDMPVISSVPGELLPASGGLAVTIFGRSFGIFPCNRTWCSSQQVDGEVVSHQGRIGLSACLRTLWKSDSSIACVAAPGIGADALISLSVLSLKSSFDDAYLQNFNDGLEGAGKVYVYLHAFSDEDGGI